MIMKLKLIHKLLIAMFASTAIVLVMVASLTSATVGRGFQAFLQQQERNHVERLLPSLAQWYTDRGGWADIERNPREFLRLAYAVLVQGAEFSEADLSGRTAGFQAGARRGRGGPPESPGAGREWESLGPGPGPRPGRNSRNALPQRLFLLDGKKQVIVGMLPAVLDEESLMPVEAGGEIVGWLGVSGARAITLPEEQAFIMQLRKSLLIGLALGLVVAVVLAWFMAKHLSRPVNKVAEGIRALAAGEYGKQLQRDGGDEISRLTDDVNRLSAALAEHETSRKRWMSDIAHELRTPLAIISGELEAMRDGIRRMGPDQLGSVQEEVEHLARLVEDLHALTLTDSGALAYKMQALDLKDLVQLSAESLAGRMSAKGLRLDVSLPDNSVTLQGDAHRLRQLLHNLLDNAVRYTDEGGRVSVRLSREGHQARLVVSDTAPGVAVDECEKLFQRLYRIEGSRNRNSGGSGLGLAICRNIVEAHGGNIQARPSADGGLEINATLPLDS
jgi:two-component system sensor histidine kinase BaeS